MIGLDDCRCHLQPKRFCENNQQNKKVKLKILLFSSHMNNLLCNQFYSGSSAQQGPAFSGSLEPLQSGTKFPVKLWTVSMDNEGWTETVGYRRA